MTTSADDSRADLKDRFGLAAFMDCEIDACGEGVVGISPKTSRRLCENVIASVVAEKLGYSSVDYVRKRYVTDIDLDDPRDEELRVMAASHAFSYDAFYHSFDPPRSDAPIGVFAFDLAMVRARSSLTLLVSLARQGFLIEPALVARALLEQFAYANYVWDKTENAEVFDVQPQNLLRHLVAVRPSAGKAYGLLSRLSHYNPKEHYQFIGEPDGSTALQRSWRFKIIATAWAFYIYDVMLSVFQTRYGQYPNFRVMEELVGSASSAFEQHFAGVDSYWVDKVRVLLKDTE